MADTNINQPDQNLEQLLTSVAGSLTELTETLKELTVQQTETNRLLKNQTDATKENTQQQQQAQNQRAQGTQFNPSTGDPNQADMQSLLGTTNAILQEMLKGEARKVKQEQQADINKATYEQAQTIRGQADTVARGVFSGTSPEGNYSKSRAEYLARMRGNMYYMQNVEGGYYNYAYQNPMAYPYQTHTIGRIFGGYATQKDYPFLKEYFYREARDKGQGWLQAQISSSINARRVIGSQQIYRATGRQVGPGAEEGSWGASLLGNALAIFGGTIGKIGQFLLNQFIKLGEFLMDGFKQYWGISAMKERIGAAGQTRLSTHVLGSDLSIGDISTQHLNESWGMARMMGFQGSSSEWGSLLARAANAGLSSNMSDRMIERSAMDMFMVRQGFGVNISDDQYGSMFRANRGQLDMVQMMNALRAVSFVNAGARGTTAGFGNMEKLFESLASHVLHTNDGFRSLINNMGTFAKMLANSTISVNELQNLVSSTQSSTLQQRMMVSYYSGASNLLEGSERQIGLSRSDPAALIRLQARALLNMASQQGFSARDLQGNALVREAMLDKFNMSALGRLPNVIQVLQELASGKTTKQTEDATKLLEDDKQILNKQLQGIEALNHTAKYIQAWLFTDKGTKNLFDQVKQMFTKGGDFIAEWLGVSDPTMTLMENNVEEGVRRALLGKLEEISDSSKQTATNTQAAVDAKNRGETFYSNFYDNGGGY